jgi:methylated-DNA-[protein]-cysteine S-methyltransferase
MLQVHENPVTTNDRTKARLVAFASPIGWIGLLREGNCLLRIKIGLINRQAVLTEFAKLEVGPCRPNATEAPWIKKFKTYLQGQPTDFGEFKIETDSMTPFQRQVVNACRAIPFGKTVSYGELAMQAGSPNAARAVGSVMRKNNFPLVVPCHRVVAANGLGGFSASNGTETKRQLLSIEGVDVDALGIFFD